ncbi:hypothetical protein GGE65_004303 [Skermanella aerolata]
MSQAHGCGAPDARPRAQARRSCSARDRIEPSQLNLGPTGLSHTAIASSCNIAWQHSSASTDRGVPMYRD